MNDSLKILLFSLLLPGSLLAILAKAGEKTLSVEQIKHYQIPIETDLYAVYREGNKVWTASEKAAFVIGSAYNEKEKDPDLGFGTAKNPLEGSERLSWGKDERRVRGVGRIQDELLFMDSEKLQMLVYREKDSEQPWPRPLDIVLDLVKPARDAKGEATRKEQASLIARLRASLSKAKGRKDLLAGMTTVPPSWKDREGSQFLIWLRIPEAPLMTMKCTPGAACVTQRACFVKGLSKKDVDAVMGIARDEDRILLGLPEQGKIVQLKGRNCFHLNAKLAFRIPPRIKSLSNLSVDDEHNLWLTTAIPDDYTSSSLFVWAKESWPR